MVESAGRRGLGRGLSALLDEGVVADAAAKDAAVRDAGKTAEATPPSPGQEVPIELLRRNPDQPRQHFDETELEELADSIRQRGVLQPILVRPAPGAPGEYQIVAGERRWRASQRANLHTVPVIVKALDDAEVAEISIIENVQRADLNPLEEALGYKTLIDQFHRTQEEVAKVVGKHRSHVANALRLLALPEAVRDHLVGGRLSAGHAKAIAAAPDPVSLAQTIVKDGLSVRQAEELARRSGDKPVKPRQAGPAKAPAVKDSDTRALEQDLADILGLTVNIVDRDGVGEVRISYATLEQLDEICRRLSISAEA
jgi:ParB family chromosome partitioning protein